MSMNNRKRRSSANPEDDGDDYEKIHRGLLLEEHQMEAARQNLVAAQQRFDRLSRRLQRTRLQLKHVSNTEMLEEVSPVDVKSTVLYGVPGLFGVILDFLTIQELGRVATCCSNWNDKLSQDDSLWKGPIMRKFPSDATGCGIPTDVIRDIREFYKSLLLATTPINSIRAPAQEVLGAEEFYLIVEFTDAVEYKPALMLGDPGGTMRPIKRIFRIDESIMEEQANRGGILSTQPHELPGVFCNCHRNAWIHLPLGNILTVPFEEDRLDTHIKYKVSILRSSDGKVARIFDTDSDKFNYVPNTTAVGLQSLRDVAVDPDEEDWDYILTVLATRSKLVYREDRVEDGSHQSSRRSRLEIEKIIFGFEFCACVSDAGNHMTPPLEPTHLATFLELAGVKWY